MAYQLLSHPLSEQTPLYGDTPKVSFQKLRSMQSGDSANTTMVSFCTHSSTHIDVPYHFFMAGKTVTDFSIDDFIFTRPVVILCPKEKGGLVTWNDLREQSRLLEHADAVLLNTGFSRFRDQAVYKTHNPGLSPELAGRIAEDYPNIRILGIDTISVSSYQHRAVGRETHKILLNPERQPPLILLEDLRLPNDEMNLKALYVMPLMLEKLDGSPVTVFAEVDNEIR